MRASAVVAFLFFASSSVVVAQVPQQVTLTAEKPVYKTGDSEPVTFTIKNIGSTAVTLSGPTPWSIWKGNILVYSPPSLAVLATLGPSQSKSWSWDKKDASGSTVSAGSYTVRVGKIYQSTLSYDLKVHIALTPSGKLSGTSYFPLKLGNEWVYLGAPTSGAPFGPISVSKIVSHTKVSSTSWYRITNLAGADRWVKFSGYTYPSLYVISVPASSGSKSLFRFKRPLGYTYTVNFPNLPTTTFKVGATNETVQTPAGTFKGVYRLDVIGSPIADAGYGSFHFAPGVGLVQYSEIQIWGVLKYGLLRASLWGSDGKQYTIGH